MVIIIMALTKSQTHSLGNENKEAFSQAEEGLCLTLVCVCVCARTRERGVNAFRKWHLAPICMEGQKDCF